MKDLAEKTKSRIDVNRTLLQICFVIFALIVGLNPTLLRENKFISIQLTFAIPLLLSSIFYRSRLLYGKKIAELEKFGFISFIIGYSFLINVLGILLSILVSVIIGISFLIFNIVLAVIYSLVEIKINKKKIKERFFKDLLFALLIVIFGILPSIGYL
jgi:hypothetical protein